MIHDAEKTPCPECGGRRVRVTAFTHHGQVAVPHTLDLKQPNRSLLSRLQGKSNSTPAYAIACTICGYTSFYATQPKNLIPDD
ncbi:MAG TPA: hypothetical protein VL461_01420 [Dictyobacter sp.]|jgi:predicted nucleic-acid-binding Zn-ribbon protein|nr:hypothetical protein [Dictyobacter sp.]